MNWILDHVMFDFVEKTLTVYRRSVAPGDPWKDVPSGRMVAAGVPLSVISTVALLDIAKKHSMYTEPAWCRYGYMQIPIGAVVPATARVREISWGYSPVWYFYNGNLFMPPPDASVSEGAVFFHYRRPSWLSHTKREIAGGL